MTIGQLIECLLGKVSALEGHDSDGTPFNDVDIDDIKNRLEKLGYHRDGIEYLYNGMTGQKIKSMIFIGPTYYHRLKHLVEDKIHCLTANHDVLTLSGWKNITLITKLDKVATLQDNKLVYTEPLNVMSYPDYEGPMYYIKNQAIDLEVTGNHRMWVSKFENNEWSPYDFELASDIVGKHRRYQKDPTIENITTTDENDYVEVNGPNDIDTVERYQNEKCPVYCIEVPSGVFYVRNNGKGCWTGNSRSRGPLTILTRQP